MKNLKLEYPNRDSSEKMLEPGQQPLERFRNEQRVQIEDGRRGLQVKIRKPLPLSPRNFLADIDALGWVDGISCLMKWKGTGALDSVVTRCAHCHLTEHGQLYLEPKAIAPKKKPRQRLLATM